MTLGETYDSVLAFIRGKVAAQLAAAGSEEAGTIATDTLLLSTGLYDSLGFFDLLAELEATFEVELDLSEHDPADFTSLGRLARIVAEQVGRNAPERSTKISGPQSGREVVLLTRHDPQWAEVGALFEAMYAGFNQQGLTLQLREDGAAVWLESLGASVRGMQCIIGCIQDGSLVGFLHGTVRIVPPHLDARLIGSIEAVYVRDSHKGQGIAGDLVHSAEQWFTAKGASHIELQVLVQNKEALGFWRRVGFRSELLQMSRALPGS